MKNILYFLLLVFGFSACQDELAEKEKYTKPEYLTGKLFTQIENRNDQDEDLSLFITCLEETGYDTIIDISGSYTVFAPTDDAFQTYFDNHSQYSSLEDLSVSEMRRIVQNQIIRNGWSLNQLQSLDYDGWIDPDNPYYNEPHGFKRKSLYRDSNQVYQIRGKGNNARVDPEEGTHEKIVYTESQKYIPIFYNEYFQINDLIPEDYTFYYDRPFDEESVYYANGKIVSEGIPAENGFFYKIDRVVPPIPNGEQILKEGTESHSYDQFLNLVYEFSDLDPNNEATNRQPGAEQGLAIDTLYNLRYPGLSFNISNELTNVNNPERSISQHGGIIAPTDQAFGQFFDTYLSDFGSWRRTPSFIKSIILGNYILPQPVYQTHIQEGILTNMGDSITIDENTITQKSFGSNATFIGLNEALIPSVFKTVTRPAFLDKNYRNALLGLAGITNIYTALQKPNADYSLFLPSDDDVGMNGDSSLHVTYGNNGFSVTMFDLSKKPAVTTFNGSVVKDWFMNHVGLRTPDGIANKEFIRTLGGKYIIVNNEEGTVSGTRASKWGYNGSRNITVYFEPYSKETTNGQVYHVNGWFNFQTGHQMFGELSSYGYFRDLLQKAGLVKIGAGTAQDDYTFLTRTEYYTVFMPSEEAVNEAGLDTLPTDELTKILKYHFIKGDIIFTDGVKPSGEYNTLAVDEEESAEYVVKLSPLRLRNSPDMIEVLDNDGDVYLEIPEDPIKTNQMFTYDKNRDNDDASSVFITNGVIHEIDKVLVKDSLQ